MLISLEHATRCTVIRVELLHADVRRGGIGEVTRTPVPHGLALNGLADVDTVREHVARRALDARGPHWEFVRVEPRAPVGTLRDHLRVDRVGEQNERRRGRALGHGRRRQRVELVDKPEDGHHHVLRARGRPPAEGHGREAAAGLGEVLERARDARAARAAACTAALVVLDK
jgi:hypothetical protein